MNIIFDIDGTLWDTTNIVAHAWNLAIKEADVEAIKDVVITGDRLKTEFGKPMDKIADSLFGVLPEDEKSRVLDLCCKYEQEILDNLERDVVEREVAYEKVGETIRDLSSRNRLFIVSNCQSGYIEVVMDKLDIESYILDHTCYGDNLLYKADNIKLIMERNGLDRAVYIGDIKGDYDSAMEAGIEFVHAAYGFGEVPESDRKINNFSELKQMF